MGLYKLIDKGAILLFFIIAMGWLAYLLNAPFHEDEAIYAAWSLALLKGDVWLSQTWIDKPPLTFYPIAFSVGLFGRYEWAARLPNLFWAALLFISCWRIAVHYRTSGKLVILFMLLSPLLWAQAASAFTDVAMLALVFSALEQGIKKQIHVAGGLFGLACLAKPTAMLLFPFLIMALLIEGRYNKVEIATTLSQLLAGLALPLLLVWAWDASRLAPSWWVLGTQAYGTLGKVDREQIGGWLYILLLSLGPILLILLMMWLYGWKRGVTYFEIASKQQHMGVVLGITAIFWIPVHLLLGFQPWERYLLPLVPITALLLTFHWALINQNCIAKEQLPCFCARFLTHKNVMRFFVIILLCVPWSIDKLQIEPHDGRWEGIREIGAVLETLPNEATIYYFDTGRPLAWYAANTKATLLWAEQDFDLSPSQLNKSSYLVRRITHPLPAMLTHESLSVINQSGQFQILKINFK